MTDQIRYIPIEDIRPSPFNRRTGDGLTDLTQSIRSIGLQQPLVVREVEQAADDGDNSVAVELVFGHRRMAALQRTGIAAQQIVPCIVRQYTDAQVIEAQITENAQREDVLPSEQALAVLDLSETGLSNAEISHRLGFGERWVAQRLLLARAHGDVLQLLNEPGVTFGAAMELARLPHHDQRAAVAQVRQYAGSRPVDRRMVTEALRGFIRHLIRAPFDIKSPRLGTVACDVCPRTTRATSDLFGDTLRDSDLGECLDRTCWGSKVQAEGKRLEGKGIEVLRVEDMTPRDVDRVWAISDQVNPGKKADIALVDVERGTISLRLRHQAKGLSDSEQALKAQAAATRIDRKAAGIVRQRLVQQVMQLDPMTLAEVDIEDLLFEQAVRWLPSQIAQAFARSAGVEGVTNTAWGSVDWRGSIIVHRQALPTPAERTAFSTAVAVYLSAPDSLDADAPDHAQALAALGIEWTEQVRQARAVAGGKAPATALEGAAA